MHITSSNKHVCHAHDNLRSIALWYCSLGCRTPGHTYISQKLHKKISNSILFKKQTRWSIGIVTELRDQQSLARNPTAARNFPLLQNAQTGIVAHPASYSVGSADFFTGVKRPGRKANHSILSSDEIMHVRIYTCTSPIWHQGARKDKFSFIFYQVQLTYYSFPRHMQKVLKFGTGHYENIKNSI